MVCVQEPPLREVIKSVSIAAIAQQLNVSGHIHPRGESVVTCPGGAKLRVWHSQKHQQCRFCLMGSDEVSGDSLDFLVEVTGVTKEFAISELRYFAKHGHFKDRRALINAMTRPCLPKPVPNPSICDIPASMVEAVARHFGWQRPDGSLCIDGLLSLKEQGMLWSTKPDRLVVDSTSPVLTDKRRAHVVLSPLPNHAGRVSLGEIALDGSKINWPIGSFGPRQGTILLTSSVHEFLAANECVHAATGGHSDGHEVVAAYFPAERLTMHPLALQRHFARKLVIDCAGLGGSRPLGVRDRLHQQLRESGCCIVSCLGEEPLVKRLRDAIRTGTEGQVLHDLITQSKRAGGVTHV